MTLEFSGEIFEKKYSNITLLWISIQGESSCSFRTDGQSDMKLIIAFRRFANAPKNEQKHLLANMSLVK
jgi:type II restriction/modification system DNA methylase subunit YeeA